MKVEELLNNDEFSFNAMFRVVRFTPTEDDPDHVDVLYESGSRKPYPEGMMDMYIGAINQNLNTGIVDLECY